MTKKSDGTPLGLCLRNREGKDRLNGVFNDDGLSGMREAADIKNWI